MIKSYYFFLPLIFGTLVSAQEISGTELLNKTIDYHDPNNSWSSFKGNLDITMSTPDGKVKGSVS